MYDHFVGFHVRSTSATAKAIRVSIVAIPSPPSGM
jgi:hypothetical protein